MRAIVAMTFACTSALDIADPARREPVERAVRHALHQLP
jgi:hypothetical protein